MSNSLAIAAVTLTLRNIIAQGISNELTNGNVTTFPPDKARANAAGGNQINVFLYHTSPNPTLRNQEIYSRVKPGETGQFPLALNLYYLITAYSDDYDNVMAHKLLGAAMRVLHDQPILKSEDIKLALEESNLHQQIEHIQITQQPLSIEEILRLWTTFQTQYRISAAYEISVVLIDSSLPVKAPLPVLARGSDDSGISVGASMEVPFPTLESVRPPNEQTAVRLGEELVLLGHHLDSDQNQFTVQMRHNHLNAYEELILDEHLSSTEISFSIPAESENFPVGHYSISVKMSRSGKNQTTNTMPFSIAPKIEVKVDGRELTVEVEPHVWPDQHAALLVGDRELLPNEPISEKTTELIFDKTSIAPGEYFVRLRVDGVDSILVDRSVKPPKFDTNQKVNISPS